MIQQQRRRRRRVAVGRATVHETAATHVAVNVVRRRRARRMQRVDPTRGVGVVTEDGSARRRGHLGVVTIRKCGRWEQRVHTRLLSASVRNIITRCWRIRRGRRGHRAAFTHRDGEVAAIAARRARQPAQCVGRVVRGTRTRKQARITHVIGRPPKPHRRVCTAHAEQTGAVSNRVVAIAPRSIAVHRRRRVRCERAPAVSDRRRRPTVRQPDGDVIDSRVTHARWVCRPPSCRRSEGSPYARTSVLVGVNADRPAAARTITVGDQRFGRARDNTRDSGVVRRLRDRRVAALTLEDDRPSATKNVKVTQHVDGAACSARREDGVAASRRVRVVACDLRARRRHRWGGLTDGNCEASVDAAQARRLGRVLGDAVVAVQA
mmetsp:Transcript_13796/g.48082  ORF Transcript_13796/g.48082 Transcript_13796/m.48082 type:complete len:378 (-) Transcript_13796:432-1565(-)